MTHSYIDPRMPLVELHRHLDGSVRLQTILELGLQHNLPLPARELESLRPYVQVSGQTPGVMAFIARFEWQVGVMADTEAVRRIAYENVEDCKMQGLDYVELRFSPLFMAQPHGLHPTAVVEATADGIRAGERDFGVKVNLIGILSRTFGTEAAFNELAALLAYKDWITAIDLAGDEANFPAEWFREHIKRARSAGWHVTIHAGESAGPESIWEALQGLGAERIGHALSALQDARLVDHLLEQRTGIESCLTSNVQTSCVADYSSHPLRRFLEKGLLATINTDDPGISAIDLPYEYNAAAPAAGLTPAQIRQAQVNALEAAFLSEEEKTELIQRAQSRSTESTDKAKT
jgi:adenosine deaminase